MRALAISVLIGVGMMAFGVASARVWTDPSGRLSFDAPSGWTVSIEPSEGLTYVIAGTADNECQFLSTPNPRTTAASPVALHNSITNDEQFSETMWLQAANSVRSIFPNNSAVFVSRSRDDSGFWPMQRAELRGNDGAVHAGLQVRPGFDILGFCLTYSGTDPVALYDQVLHSMGHPNDAAFRADAERATAEAEAQAAAEVQAEAERNSRRRH